MHTRSAEIRLEGEPVDYDARVVPVVVSSDQPVPREYDGQRVYEILSHDPAAIDLQRQPLPLTVGHDANAAPIGVVEGLKVVAGKLRGFVRMGSTQAAKEIWADVKRGVVRSLSVGYEVTDYKASTTAENTVIATRWMPFEVSVVSAPGDSNAGFFRSRGNVSMPEETTPQAAPEAAEQQPTISVRGSRSTLSPSAQKERQRVQEISHLATLHDCHDLATRAITEGWRPDRMRQVILQRLEDEDAGETFPANYGTPVGREVGMTPREIESYSVVSAIRSLYDPQFKGGGLEREASRAMADQLKKEPRGLLIPVDVQRSWNGPRVGTRQVTYSGSGSNLVAVEHLSEQFVDVLRNRMILPVAGAQTMGGLVGNISIPTKVAPGTSYWLELDDTSTITLSTQQYGSITAEPHSAAGLSRFSHRMLTQSSPDIELLTRQDLADTVAVSVDNAAINGDGTGATPLGIVNTPNVDVSTYTAPLDLADVVAMETAVGVQNADAANASYVCDANVRGALKTQDVSTSTGIFVWQNGAQPGEGRINGYRSLMSNQIVADAILFGNFADVVLCEWGSLELMSDPFSNFNTGSVSVRCIYDCDFVVRRPESFSYRTLAP